MTARCDYCKSAIPDAVHPYTLRLELYPAVEPSVEWSQEVLNEDHMAELKKLIRQMRQMSDEQVAESEKLIYTMHRFTLCPQCRNVVAERLATLLPPDF